MRVAGVSGGDPMNQTLSYESPRTPTPTEGWHKIAQFCGLIPLGFGTFVFLMFLLTRSPQFAILGFFTILAGVCLALIGIVCAIVYLFQASRTAEDERLQAQQKGHRDIRIILANFLVAAVMMWIGSELL
jgi:Ca2+/Na+ antiporter